MYNINPKHGYYSSIRKTYDKIDSKEVSCRDLLTYLNLEKFGNDSKNFAAILINGHCDHRINDLLQKKIIQGLQSNNFTKSVTSNDIEKYIEMMLSQFEEDFLNKMLLLSKKRQTMFQQMSKSENEDPKQLQELDDMENQLNSGATVAIVAIIKGILYISNIGDNQVILVSNDDDCTDEYNKKFMLLTDEQSFQNEKEIQRIKEDCGLDPDALRWLLTLSTERCHSRCIGDFEIKCNYSKFQNISHAKTSPLISTPEPIKCIPLEESFTHILLISSGLYYLVRELIYDKDKVPGEITRKIFEIRRQNPQSTLDQLCLSVIESFVNDHKVCHDQYKNLTTDDCVCWEYSHHDDLSLFVIELNISQNQAHIMVDAANGFSLIDSVDGPMSTLTDSIDGKDSSNNMKDQFSSLKTSNNASINQVQAYVDFTDWSKAMDQLTESELAFVDSIIDAPESCVEDTISEEVEGLTISRSTTLSNTSIMNSPLPQLLMFKSLDE